MGIFGSFRSPDFKTGGSENINTLDKVQKFTNWGQPSFAADVDKIENFVINKLNHKRNDDDFNDIVYKLENLIDSEFISPELLNDDLWATLQDDESHNLEKIEDETKFKDFVNGMGSDAKDLLNRLVKDKMVETPLILKYKDANYVLIGEKRLKIFRTAGAVPMVKIVDLDGSL